MGPGSAPRLMWRRRDAHLNSSSGGPGGAAAGAAATRGGPGADARRRGFGVAPGTLDDEDEEFVLAAGSMAGPSVVFDVEAFMQHAAALALLVPFPWLVAGRVAAKYAEALSGGAGGNGRGVRNLMALHGAGVRA